MRAFLGLVFCTALLLGVAAQGQKVGYITTVGGTGVSGFSGDGGLSTSAKIFYACANYWTRQIAAATLLSKSSPTAHDRPQSIATHGASPRNPRRQGSVNGSWLS